MPIPFLNRLQYQQKLWRNLPKVWQKNVFVQKNRRFNIIINIFLANFWPEKSFVYYCSAQTRTGMGYLRNPPGVELIPAVD